MADGVAKGAAESGAPRPASRDERQVDQLVALALRAVPDVDQVRVLTDQLAGFKGDRAVFGLCVLTLELALLKEDRAREELPSRVGVLLEAHSDSKLASMLVAGSPDLAARWARIQPVVAEFVAGRSTPPPLPPAGERPAPLPRLATPIELVADIQEIIEEEPQEIEVEVVEPAPAAGARPPPLPRGTTPLPPPSKGPPPIPKGTPPPPSEQGLDPATRAFWAYTEQALGRVPDQKQTGVGMQSFAVEGSSDRARLVRFARDLVTRFPNLKHARALASMVLLLAAGHEKERGLLGGVNKERQEIIRAGLSLLGDPAAAAQVAVLFETDGPATKEAFSRVTEQIAAYLAFCSLRRLDPRASESATRFVSAS